MTPDELAGIKRVLARRCTRRTLGALLQAVGGVMFCALPVVFFGTIGWLSCGTLGGGWYSWRLWAAGAAVVTLPLLFRLEWRTAGNYLARRLDEGPVGGSGWDGAVALVDPRLGLVAGVVETARDPRSAAVGFVEWFLFGPRLLIGASRSCRLLVAGRRLDWDRAAAVIARLLAHERGVSADRLVERGEPRRALLPVLGWLAAWGWIGVAEDQRLVYLYSESRALLPSSGARSRHSA